MKRNKKLQDSFHLMMWIIIVVTAGIISLMLDGFLVYGFGSYLFYLGWFRGSYSAFADACLIAFFLQFGAGAYIYWVLWLFRRDK